MDIWAALILGILHMIVCRQQFKLLQCLVSLLIQTTYSLSQEATCSSVVVSMLG